MKNVSSKILWKESIVEEKELRNGDGWFTHESEGRRKKDKNVNGDLEENGMQKNATQ